MRQNNKYDRDELNRLINVEHLPYLEIARRYGVSVNAIRNAAKRRGIYMPSRRRINPKETFGKGVRRKERVVCERCGCEFIPYPTKSNRFCSKRCQVDAENEQHINDWKEGKVRGCDSRFKLHSVIKRYLLEQSNYQCEKCGFCTPNPFTNKTILQIHHIDGNAANTHISNLQVLCPNCHALTDNFGSRNRNSARYNYRKSDYEKSRL